MDSYAVAYTASMQSRTGSVLEVDLLRPNYTGTPEQVDLAAPGVKRRMSKTDSDPLVPMRGQVVEIPLLPVHEDVIQQIHLSSDEWRVEVRLGGDLEFRGIIEKELSSFSTDLYPTDAYVIRAICGLGALKSRGPLFTADWLEVGDQDILLSKAEVIFGELTGLGLDLPVAMAGEFVAPHMTDGVTNTNPWASEYIQTAPYGRGTIESSYEQLRDMVAEKGAFVVQHGGMWHIYQRSLFRKDTFTRWVYTEPSDIGANGTDEQYACTESVHLTADSREKGGVRTMQPQYDAVSITYEHGEAANLLPGFGRSEPGYWEDPDDWSYDPDVIYTTGGHFEWESYLDFETQDKSVEVRDTGGTVEERITARASQDRSVFVADRTPLSLIQDMTFNEFASGRDPYDFIAYTKVVFVSGGTTYYLRRNVSLSPSSTTRFEYEEAAWTTDADDWVAWILPGDSQGRPKDVSEEMLLPTLPASEGQLRIILGHALDPVLDANTDDYALAYFTVRRAELKAEAIAGEEISETITRAVAGTDDPEQVYERTVYHGSGPTIAHPGATWRGPALSSGTNRPIFEWSLGEFSDGFEVGDPIDAPVFFVGTSESSGGSSSTDPDVNPDPEGISAAELLARTLLRQLARQQFARDETLFVDQWLKVSPVKALVSESGRHLPIHMERVYRTAQTHMVAPEVVYDYELSVSASIGLGDGSSGGGDTGNGSDSGGGSGTATWENLIGRPEDLYSASGTRSTELLDDVALIDILGYTPFDEQGGDILGSVEIDGSLSVQGNTSMVGDLNVTDEFTAGLATVGGLDVQGDTTLAGTVTAENDVTVQGNLTVLGTEFIADTETVEISDNLAVINSGETGSGVTAGFSGWRVDRGTAEDYEFGFDEGRDRFVVGKTQKQVVATREDAPIDGGLGFYNSSTNRFETTNQVTWDGSILKVGTGSTRISDSDVDTGSVVFANKEQSDFSDDGRLYWDKSAGMYVRSSNGLDGTTPRLLWSGDNVTAGKNVRIDYAGEDEPTLAVTDDVDLTGYLRATDEVRTNRRFALGGIGGTRAYLRIESRFGGVDDTVELNVRDKNGGFVSDVMRIHTEGSDQVDANLNWHFLQPVTLEGLIGTNHYAAQQTGWRILHDGSADFRNIYADELTVQTFTAELTQSLAGSDILTKSAADLSRPFDDADATTTGSPNLYVETPPEAQGRIFGVGDTLRLRSVDRSGGGLQVADVWLRVIARYSFDGEEQEYEVEELQAPGSFIIRKGARVLDYGVSGDTIIERTVNGPGAPFDRIARWTDTTGDGVPDSYETVSQIGNISDQTDTSTGIYTASARLTDDIRIGDLGGSYLEFDGSLTIVTAQHGDLDSAISTINTNVSDNSASISAVASTQSSQGDAISALQIDVSENAGGISANSSLISQLDTDLGNVEAGLQTQINSNENSISSNLSLINTLQTDTSDLFAGLDLITSSGRQNLLQYVFTESELTTTYTQTGGSSNTVVKSFGSYSLDDIRLEVGDKVSYSFEASFEDPQSEGGFIGVLIRFSDSNGDTIQTLTGQSAPRGRRIDSDTGGAFELAYAEGMTIPPNTASIQLWINSNNEGTNQTYKGRRPMLVRGPKAVAFSYDAQALAAFELSAQNESGLASVEGRVTDAESALDLTVAYDGQSGGLFLTADGSGTTLELDADQILLSGSVTADLITVDDLSALQATIAGWRMYRDDTTGAGNIAADNNDVVLGSEFGLRLRASDSAGERNAINWLDLDSTGTLLAESFIQGRGADLYYATPDGGQFFRGKEFTFQPPADYGTSGGVRPVVRMLTGLKLQDLPTSSTAAGPWEVWRDGNDLRIKLPDTQLPPVANLRVKSKSNLDVTFDASNSYSEASAGLEYRFRFESGGTYTSWQFEPEIAHTYAAAGTYTATVEVRDQGNNQTDTDSTTVTVSTSTSGGGSNDDNGSSIAF